MLNDKENIQLPEDDEFPSIEELFARKRKRIADQQEQSEKENGVLAETAVTRSPKVKAEPEIPIATPILFLDDFTGLYVPGKILEVYKNGHDCYKITSYTGEVKISHKKYICTPSDSHFYTVKLMPKQEVLDKLEPALSESDKARLSAIISKHKEHLKNVISGDTRSERDITFMHKHKSALYHMNTKGPFTKPESAYINLSLAKEFKIDLEDEVDKIKERFSKCKLDFASEFPSYAQLVLAPELVVCHLMDLNDCDREQAETMLQDHDFHPNISYIQALYTQRDIYRYARLEKKSKMFL